MKFSSLFRRYILAAINHTSIFCPIFFGLQIMIAENIYTIELTCLPGQYFMEYVTLPM